MRRDEKVKRVEEEGPNMVIFNGQIRENEKYEKTTCLRHRDTNQNIVRMTKASLS